MIATADDKQKIKKLICKKAEEGIFEHRQVVIFGCTIYARDIRDALRDNEIVLNAIIDNNPQKVGQRCLGVLVYEPSAYLVPYNRDVMVIICSKYHYEMTEQLKCMGYTEEDNVFVIPVSESNNWENDSIQSLRDDFEQVVEGYNVYKQLKNLYSAEYKFLVCPYPGTGDIYIACTFLKAYIEKEDVEQYVFVVGGNSCAKVARLFGIPNIEVLDMSQIQFLLKAWEFVGAEKMNLKPLLYWGWRTKRYLYADKFPQITFTEMFQYDVYRLEEDTRKDLPKFNMNLDYVEKMFKQFGLCEGKTIILAPYASSFVSEVSIEIWEKIAYRLTCAGYTVCTNCFGDKEAPIKGTIPVFFPYDEAANVLERAGAFIALRSGLCDVVSSATCKMIIIYENGFNASRYEYFSLEKMGLNENVLELVYDGDEEIFIDKVIKYII